MEVRAVRGAATLVNKNWQALRNVEAPVYREVWASK